MPRVNVYVPAELAESVRERLPGINVSAVLQQALRALLRCDHAEAVCSACAAPIPVEELQRQALDAFYVELIDALAAHIARDGTVHGTARVAQNIAERHGIPSARTKPVPLGPRHGKRRHPSSGAPLVRELDGPGMPAAPELPDLREPRRHSA